MQQSWTAVHAKPATLDSRIARFSFLFTEELPFTLNYDDAARPAQTSWRFHKAHNMYVVLKRCVAFFACFMIGNPLWCTTRKVTHSWMKCVYPWRNTVYFGSRHTVIALCIVILEQGFFSPFFFSKVSLLCARLLRKFEANLIKTFPRMKDFSVENLGFRNDNYLIWVFKPAKCFLYAGSQT